MNKAIRRIQLNKQLIRYIAVGGISFLLEIGLLAFLRYVLNIDNILAVSLSFWFGFSLAFLLQRVIAFGDRTKSVKRVFKQTIIYSILVGINFLFTLFFVQIASAVLGLLVARTVALVITTGWNYLFYSKVIFK